MEDGSEDGKYEMNTTDGNLNRKEITQHRANWTERYYAEIIQSLHPRGKFARSSATKKKYMHTCKSSVTFYNFPKKTYIVYDA